MGVRKGWMGVVEKGKGGGGVYSVPEVPGR